MIVADSTDYNYITPNKAEENHYESQGNEYFKLNRDNRQQSNEYQKPTRTEGDEVQELYVGPEPQPEYEVVQSDPQYLDVRGNDTEEQPQYLDVVSHEEELYSDVSDTVERTPQSHIHQDSEELEIYEN